MAKEYKNPSVAADGIIIKDKKILLVRRGHDPYAGSWALPGGFVNYGERTEDAVVREVREETTLETVVDDLVGVYSDPRRDPRGHVISITYLLKNPIGEPHGSDDAKEARWWDIDSLPSLAFDHAKIIAEGLRLYKQKKLA